MRPTVLFAAVLLLIGAGIGADRLLGEVAPAAPQTTTSGPSVAGAAYCAVGDTVQGNNLALVTAAPSVGTRPAETRIDQLSEGTVTRGPEVEVFPSTATTALVPGGAEDVASVARWWRNPAVLTRAWEVNAAGVPGGLVEGPCPASPSSRWVVPGLTTAGGASAHLVLANPFETDATLSISLLTPDGPVQPILLENVVVPRHAVRRILVNEHRPEELDVGLVVETRAGRVVAEAYQVVDAAVGGVEGVSLVPATAAPAETWTAPWFQDDTPPRAPLPPEPAPEPGAEEPDPSTTELDAGTETPSIDDAAGARSWIWVANAEDRPAAVTVTLHTVEGGVTPDGLEELTVPPGSTTRIDLAGLLPEGPRRGAWTVRSENGVPIVAASATRLAADDEARTGIAVSLAAAAPDPVWVLSGRAGAGRSAFVHLVNPTSEEASVRIDLWGGLGIVTAPELTSVTVPPGAVTSVDIGVHLPESATEATAFVTVTAGRVVAGWQAQQAEGRLDLTASLGVPSARWSGGREVAPVTFEPGLSRRIGTQSGPAVEPDLLPREEDEEPLPDPGGSEVAPDDPVDGPG